MRTVVALMALVVGCTEDNDSAMRDPDTTVAGDGAAGAGGDMAATPDGAAGAGGQIDQGMAGAGGEGGSVDPCVAVCERFGDCAVEICADLGAAGRPSAVQACRAACDTQPSFAPVAGGTETCNDLVAFGRQTLDPSFAEQCMADPDNPPELAECTAFGDTLAECVVARCPPTAEAEGVLARAFSGFCNSAAAQGMLDPMVAAALGAAGCQNPDVASIVEEQVTGDLAAFCAEGPRVDPALCAEACMEVGPCIPPESEGAALRNADLCIQFCVTNPAFTPAAWACVAEGGQCQEIIACLQTVEPPPMTEHPECVPFGERLTECIAAECANVAGIEAGLDELGRLICNQQVNEMAGGDVSGLVGIAEAACDDARIAPFVGYFIEDTPATDEDGSLVALCENGPLRDLALCEAGCAKLAPCIPEGSDSALLRNVDVCVWFCATNADLATAAWECFEEAPAACEAVLACTQ